MFRQIVLIHWALTPTVFIFPFYLFWSSVSLIHFCATLPPSLAPDNWTCSVASCRLAATLAATSIF